MLDASRRARGILDLYGFPAEEELASFELLLSVSGIGPKSALAILDIASSETLRSAIASGNAAYLTNVSGIGKKTAEKIVLELKDKVLGGIERGPRDARGRHRGARGDARAGLFGRRRPQGVAQRAGRCGGSSERLREALAASSARSAKADKSSIMSKLIWKLKRIVARLVPPALVRAYHLAAAFLGALLYGFPSSKLR